MIYWLCLFFCINLRSSFGNPPFYNMPEVNPFILGPNVEENYGEYSDTRFDSQWNPWYFNSQPEMHPLRSDFVDSGMNFHPNQENIEETALRPLRPHHRNMKFNKTMKSKLPVNILDPYENYKTKINAEQEDSDDYETDIDTELRKDAGNNHLPSNRMINPDDSLDMTTNFAKEYENKRDDGSLSNMFLGENSADSYSEITSKFSEMKDSSKLENNKRNSDYLRTEDVTTELVADSSLNSNENVNSNNNKRSMQSLRNVYITDKAISDVSESITNLNNHDESPEYNTDKSNDLINNMQSLEDNHVLASNNVQNGEYMASPSKKRNDNLMLRDTNFYDNQKFFPQLAKLGKTPRAPNKTKLSQAVPKLTFYNAIQSSTKSDRSEYTTETPFHLNTKGMTNNKFKSGMHQFHKHQKTKSDRDPLFHFQQKLGMGDHKSLTSKKERKREETGKIYDSQKTEIGSNEENGEKDLLYDYTKNNQDTNLKAKKSLESKPIEALKDFSSHNRHDSSKYNINDPNLSKKRSVDIRDVTTEKESAIHFQRNFENQNENTYLSDTEETITTPKTVQRSPKNLKLKNRINNYKRQNFPNKKHSPLTPDILSNRKSLHHSNPYHPYAEYKFSKNDHRGRNQKRMPAYSRPTGLELKELSGPHNYELNIAKQLNKKRAKVDEKLSRTMEDYKVKKTVLKDAKTRKETDIVENEKEKVVDKVHVVSDPNQKKTPIPVPVPINVPFVQKEPADSYSHQDYEDEVKSPEGVVESDSGDINVPPDLQISEPSVAEEELEQGDNHNAVDEDYYEEESKEKVVSDNYYDIDADQEDEAAQKIPVSPIAENKAIPNQVDINVGLETSEGYQENYDEDYSEDSETFTEIPPKENVKPMKVVNEYLPPAKLPLYLPPEQASRGQIYEASPPPPDIVFQNLKKNRLNQQKYKPHYSKGNKHKQIYHFSTEYAVSYGMEEFEKEEKLEKASKTVVRNKLMTANESSHHFQEKKTEIKNNKESYHEAYIEEKDESKFPREIDRSGNLQRSIAASNPNSDLDSDYPRRSADDNDQEIDGNREHDGQSGREYSGRISERYSPSYELKLNENLIDNAKRSQPSFKISRDANTDLFTNNTQAQEDLHEEKRDSSSQNTVESDQETYQKYFESNLEDSPKKNKVIRDSTKEWKESDTPSWTVPHSESKSGNVVYITMSTTTMDLEKKYHDFIQIQDDKRSPGRYERHPKHYRRKRKRNRFTEKKTFEP